MILELVGSRILAPTLGTSIFVWTSLIGVILGAMSLGYYFGGRLADKNPSLEMFSLIILAAGVFVFFVIILKDAVLGFSLFWGIRYGSVFASIFLFSVPAVFLGAVSPYAVRLAMKNVESSGNTVGNLYAVSTFGSIAGTFIAGFYLIPAFGSTNILYALAITLFLISLLSHRSKDRVLKVSLSLFLLFGITLVSSAVNKNSFIVDKDSAYNHIRVYDSKMDGREVRIMSVENFFDSGMFLDSDELVFEYSKYFRLDEVFKKEVKKAVIFGGAAYSIPKDFLIRNKTGKIDVVEIDPKTTEIAKKFFRLRDDERMTIYHQDARTFLNFSGNNKYDVVYNDAFSSACTVPFHLTTKEAVGKIYSVLNKDGIYIMNLISAVEGEKSEFFRSEYKTLRRKFRSVLVFPTLADDGRLGEKVQNIVILASKRDINIDKVLEDNQESKFKEMLNHYWKKEIKTDDLEILTDDFAPVNYYASKVCEL
jgi:spermidine synthase